VTVLRRDGELLSSFLLLLTRHTEREKKRDVERVRESRERERES